jgi:hypothetical protein
LRARLDSIPDGLQQSVPPRAIYRNPAELHPESRKDIKKSEYWQLFAAFLRVRKANRLILHQALTA